MSGRRAGRWKAGRGSGTARRAEVFVLDWVAGLEFREAPRRRQPGGTAAARRGCRGSLGTSRAGHGAGAGEREERSPRTEPSSSGSSFGWKEAGAPLPADRNIPEVIDAALNAVRIQRSPAEPDVGFDFPRGLRQARPMNRTDVARSTLSSTWTGSTPGRSGSPSTSRMAIRPASRATAGHCRGRSAEVDPRAFTTAVVYMTLPPCRYTHT